MVIAAKCPRWKRSSVSRSTAPNTKRSTPQAASARLCDTLEGKVENLNYKTVRYPGHRDIVKMLVRDLRLGLRRDILKDVLETAIPITYQDVVLIFVTVSGWMRRPSDAGKLRQEDL